MWIVDRVLKNNVILIILIVLYFFNMFFRRVLIKNIIQLFVLSVVAAAPSDFLFAEEIQTIKSDVSLSDGLVSYWSMDEEIGIRKDIVGGNDLIPEGNVIGISAVQGYGADFVKNNIESLYVEHVPELEPGSDYSISLWYRHDSSEYNVQSVISKDGVNPLKGYTLFTDDGSILYMTHQNITTLHGPTLEVGKWYHIVATHDATNNLNFLYVNNSAPYTVPGGYLDSEGATLRVGGYNYNTNYYSDGAVDELGYWNRVLTQEEVGRLYNEGEGVPYDVSNEDVDDGVSSVAFIPGITGSRLYVNSLFGEDKLWESIRLGDLSDIGFTKDGVSERNDVYTRDVVETLRPVVEWWDYAEGYSDFMEYLNILTQEGLINEWEALPYDWRMATDKLFHYGENLGNGNISYLTGEQDEPYIITRLEELAENSQTGKVTIVAHSNGGLVARNLLKYLQDTNHPLFEKIDKVILVSSPLLGTPKTIGELLHGTTNIVEGATRDAMENMPGVYGLLPSQILMSNLNDPVVEVDYLAQIENPFKNFYDTKITTYDDLVAFLLGELAPRNEPDSTETWMPNILNKTILEDVRSMHSGVDSQDFPENIEVVSIIGTDLPTARAVRYTNCLEYHVACVGKESETLHEWLFTTRGDGTVVTTSAKGGVGVDKTVFVSLTKIGKDEGENYRHATILSSLYVQNVIKSVLLGMSDEIEGGTEGVNTVKRIELKVYSPVDVHFYKDDNHTGVVKNGEENDFGREYEQEVPTSYYREWGEVTYLGTELYDDNLDITFKGKEVGMFTLTFDVYLGEELLDSYIFKDIPVNSKTEGWIELTEGGEPILHYDGDGDGEIDFTLKPDDSIPDSLRKWVRNKFRVIAELMQQKGKGVAIAIESQFSEISHKLQKTY